ncbi:MAG: hypothetical protein KJO49_09145 [Bacteroidia bacterium]|nr:hypothetical protein [Bacteroidia bacterium]MBT8270348.1 hypothetical protein [Bacteroidia bacterium]NNF82403.1 hypothetical protein [Flavobacteriaceae bacterium]NNK70545.1 hypothetical protein [Flavobacteriaceae bacterium]NNL79127.1 hypothetical protein [Flavobacteriaceae bacterium]
MHSGNYDHAISDALKKLHNNKDRKWKQKFVILLEESYNKAVDRDLRTIDKLKKSDNPEHLRMVYDIYVNMDARQEAIKPLMPLRIGKRIIRVPMRDYSKEIFQTRDVLVKYTYSNVQELLVNPTSKMDYRFIYDQLAYIENIQPNYKDVRSLMQEAHFNGIDFVLVEIDNQTHQIIPVQLEQDLLSFETYGLDNFWTAYHSQPQENVRYDFGMQLQLRQINLTPERMLERMHLRQKQIVDGWEYLLDEQGNVAQDSLGNDIKVDRIVNVRARVFEIEQLKSARVSARVEYRDLRSGQLLDAFPLDSEFHFRNSFARMRGDERALTERDVQLLNNRRLPFPTDEQMVFDTGEDIKIRLKSILNSYNLQG